jgi:hypothetical protein
MEAKTSKAQLEVWDWKEKAYQEMKHLSTPEQINYIRMQTKALVEKIKKAKKLREKNS